MPTKPVDTFFHATDANFTSGPASGSPTTAALADPAQGFIPGTGVAAETANLPLNICGQWISNWLSLGSNTADLDAHILETDASGDASIAVINAGGTAATSGAITAVENSGATATTILGTNSSGGVGVAALASGGGVGMSSDVFDTCDGVIGQVRGSGAGVIGRVLTGLGTGTAIKGEGSVIGGPTMDLEFDATNPARGLIALQSTDVPSAPIVGDHWYRGTDVPNDRRGSLEYRDDLGAPSKAGPGKLRVWSTPEGIESFQTIVAGPISTVANAASTAASLTIPKEVPVGIYRIEWSCQISPDPLPAPGPADRGYVGFTFGGATLLEDEMTLLPAPVLPVTSPALVPGSKTISGSFLFVQAVSPAASDYVATIEFASVGSVVGSGVKIAYCEITALGVFD